MNIKIKNVSKTFKGDVKALDGINLEIGTGIFGLLGQNGAGKTTLMRILTTIYDASDGTIEMDGILYNKSYYKQIRKRIGYLPQELGIYPNLTVRESLEYIGTLSDIPSDVLKKRIDSLLDKTDMDRFQNRKNKQLSGGMKRRVGLIQAMLTQPDLLIVDEPTAGVDPEERIRLRKMISDYSATHSVIFSTHVIEDLLSVCNRLCVLSKGKVKYSGTVSDMIQLADGHCFVCDVNLGDEKNIECDDIYVISKNIQNDMVRVKFLAKEPISTIGERVSPNLEDAYIYINHFK